MKDFFIVLVVLSVILAVKTKECALKYGNHDFSSLDWPSWTVNSANGESYEINVCRPLKFDSSPGKDDCSNSALCMFKNGTARSLVDFPLNVSIKNIKNGYEVEFKGPVCSVNKNINEVVTLSLICDRHLGSPELSLKGNCMRDFIWKTSAACNSLPKTKEVPCYIYDNDFNKRDLSHLILSKGDYLIESTYPSDELHINICSEITDDEAPEESAAYKKSGNEKINFGKPVSGIFLSGNDLMLVYNTSTVSPGCTRENRVVITFKCPERGGGHNPRIVFFANCQYDIEWETEYACSEEILIGNFSECTFTLARHQIELDLSPLKKISGYYDIKSNETTFKLNVCGGIGSIPCNNQVWKSNSVCMFIERNSSEVIGSTRGAELRYVDGQITLIYPTSIVCKSIGVAKLSVIEFECDENADDDGIGKPVFYMENNCKYIFKWRTKYACLTHPSNNKCYINNGKVRIDLGVLIKNGNKSWNVINNLENEEKSTFILNICSDMPNYCKPESAVCKIDENGKAVSVGKSVSPPKYNIEFKTIDIIYENGELCEGGYYSTHVTLYCKPGMLDSPPILKTVTNKGCLYEIEWHTAAACPLKVHKGSDCKVFDNDLGYTVDLNQLKSNTSYEIKTEEYTYYLNVCGPVTGTKCDENKENFQAAVCQVDKNGRTWNLGKSNSELFYVDGMINLTYAYGSPYNDENKTPRMTSVTFLCDHNAGIGKPEFVKEITQAYSFQWKTSYACPTSNVVNCYVKDHKNGIQYDFSRLTKTVQEGNWVVTHNANGRKRKFYLNVCHPLNPVEEPCSSDSFACVIETDEEGDVSVHNLGKMISEPEFNAQGHLVVKYTSGDSCMSYGNSTNYTTSIHFLCGKEIEELRFLSVLGNCEYMFLWTTEVACGIKTELSKNKCNIIDPLTEYILDFQSLKKEHGYNVTAGSRNFKLNICGTTDACKFEDKNVSACEFNDGKPSNVLGLLKDYYLKLSDDKIVTLTYEGIHDQSSGTISKVYISLLCKQGIKESDIKFVHQDDDAYFFEMETSFACFPDQIDCSFSDSFGNEYDLRSLIKWKNENWEAVDPYSNYRYHINFCKPLNPSPLYVCPAGEVMSCQTLNDTKDSISLGFVQEKPIVHSRGIISLRYKIGTPCQEGLFNRSTTINLKCSTVQKDLVFIGETIECRYIFSMDTPVACPIKNAIGSYCTVEVPGYEYTLDLSPLHQEIEPYHVKDGEYEYILNVCGEIKNASEKCKGAAACQTKPSDSSFAINTGMPNSNLLYDGLIQLTYESGKGNCHRKYNRSTVITFTCDHSTSGAEGPKFLEEKDDCTYMFEWPTSLVCLPYSVHQCSVDDGKSHYDLSPLSLSNSNYVIDYEESSVFAINVCRSIVTSDKILCPLSGACLIDFANFTEYDKIKEVNIGEVSFPYIENGKLKLNYTKGDKCKLFSGEEVNLETVIEFECKEKLMESEPQFIGMENCTYYFSWLTAFACPVKVDDDSENCIVENPNTGFKYDLSLLKKNSSYEVKTNSHHKYYINVCGSIENSTCGPNIGSCQEDEEKNKRWNAGLANSKLYFRDGTLFLNYSGGDTCHGKYSRSTIIEFKCSIEVGEPIFQFESEDCTYYFIWLTPLACKSKQHCVVSNGSQIYDLTPLSRLSFDVNDLTGKNDLYYLRVCDSIKLYRTNCPPNAGICKINKVNNSALSLGIPTSPIIDFEGYVTILYPYGSFCKNKEQLSSRIIFLCDTSVEMGEPELITADNDCHYIFHWKTSLVCPKTDFIENPSVNNCTYKDIKNRIEIDLSPLRKVNSNYEVKGRHNTFLLNICGSVNSSKPGCSSAAVCRHDKDAFENENFGSVNSASLSYNAQTLTLHYSEGDSCIMNSSGKRSSSILFSCNPKAGIGEPKLHKELTCLAVFKWETNLVCTNPPTPCSFNLRGQHYDLQLLSSLSHDWNITDNEGNIYWLNICSETKISKSYLTCQNSPICRKDTKGNAAALGKLQTQEYHFDSDGNLILSYVDGSSSVCPKKSTNAKVDIKFVCGNTLSFPKYTSGPNDECIFEFLWKTRIACIEEKKQAMLEENGIIYDPKSNMNIDLSYLLNNTYSTEGTHYDESYTYIINIEKGVKDTVSANECQNAAVCQTKQETFFRDIGSLATRKFYLKGTELQLELISLERKCGKNKNKNVTTIINFVCVEGAGTGKPLFYYESGNCDYLFEWETASVCGKNFKVISQQHTKSDNDASHSVSVTTKVVLALVFSAIFLVVIVFILSKEERRNAVRHKISRIILYISLSKCFRKNDSESLPLSSSAITAYHDDSDVEILT